VHIGPIQARDRAIHTAHPHQLLLKPGGFPHQEGEGGGSRSPFQPFMPELLEVGHYLHGRDFKRGLERELGGHGNEQ
jgi:hypothetical protein